MKALKKILIFVSKQDRGLVYCFISNLQTRLNKLYSGDRRVSITVLATNHKNYFVHDVDSTKAISVGTIRDDAGKKEMVQH
jgi:hypothetical protein